MLRTENRRARILPTQHTALRPRILLVHSSVQLCRKLVDGLSHAGYNVFQARGRVDGLPLLYQVHPELILLEISEATDETLEIFSRIRILTDVPVILLDKFQPNPIFESLADQNAQVLAPPLAVAKVIRAVKATLKSSVAPSPESIPTPQESPVSLRSDDLNLEQQLVWLHALLARIRTVQAPAEAVDHVILEHLSAVVGAEWVALHVVEGLDPSSLHFRPVLLCGSEAGARAGAWTEAQALFLQERMAEAVQTQRMVPYDPFLSGDELPASSMPESVGLGPYVIVPLIGRDQVHGTLAVIRRATAGHDYTRTEIQFIMTAAETFALAMDNASFIQRAREAAILDAVTGLYSPTFAERILANEQARTDRCGRSFAVVRLNWVNGQCYREAWGVRTYAHTLREIAEICKKQVRAVDIVARSAEESFEFVLPETDALQAQNVASRLGQAIQARFVDDKPEVRPNVTLQVVAGWGEN